MHITELDLSPSALARLRSLDLTDVDELARCPASELIERGVGGTELYEIVCHLKGEGRALPPLPRLERRKPPSDRETEMFRLRLVEGLTLEEVSEQFSVTRDRVRQLLVRKFGLRGWPPTVQARKWAATERRRREREAAGRD